MNDPQPSVEDLFHRLRALSATARAAFLDRELANDPAKRARVERLLAADIGDTSDFLAPKQPAPAPDVLGEKPGDAIDRYKLLQAIGEGGMGTVWMAEQKEPVVRKVALKIVKLGMDTREVVVRFEAERQALALMDHPHIAKVLDGGATPTGRPFFVMELVRGVPITDYCDQAKLGLRERLELFAKVCEAIQHAHHKGVIHRDIKPSNVLVTLHDGVPVPKVIDFGIAKATSAELTKKTLFTQYAQILGTPEYMAPEQAEMSGLDVDTRADVYSLGVLLYELLTGTKPFDIKTAMRVGFQELLRTIREDDPPRPSTRVSTLGEAASPVAARREVNVRAWSERLRGDLDWIVMKALEKDRTRRYDSPHGFAEDLARFLRDEAVAAAPPSAAYRLRKLVRRRRKTVAAGLVGALLLLGGLAGTSWGMWRASVEAGKARAAEALEHARANENDRIANFQATLLGGVDVPAMGVDLRKSLLAAAPAAERDELTQRLAAVNFTDLALGSLDSSVFQRSIRTIEEEFAAEPHMRARLLQVVGDTMRGLGLLQAARAPIERALALATATFGSGDPRTLSVLGSQMSLQLDANDFEAAERTGRRLLDGVQKALGDDDRDTMLAHLYLGKVLSARGALDEAATHLQRALDGLARFDGPDARTVLDVKNSLMVLTMRRGPTKEATRLARELLEQQRRVLGAHDAATINTIGVLGTMLGKAGQMEDAEQCMRDVLASYRQRFGDAHPRTLFAKHQLAVVLQQAGRPVEAEPLAREAHGEQVRVLGARHPDTLASAGTIGAVSMDKGDLAEAERWLPAAVAAQRDVLGADHVSTLGSAGELAVLRRAQGREDEALEIFRTVMEGWRRVCGPIHDETLSAANNYAAALWTKGRAADAVPIFRETLAAQTELLGAEDRATLRTAGNLAVNLRDTGQVDEALPLFRRAFEASDRIEELRWVGRELLLALAQTKRAADLVQVAPRVVTHLRQAHPDDQKSLATGLSSVGNALLMAEQWTAAEPLVREALAIRSANEPDAWQTFNSKAQLGAALAGQRRFVDAESPMVEGAAGLWDRRASIPPPARIRVKEALERTVGMYTAWDEAEPGRGLGEKNAVWRTRLAEFAAGK